ncbi:histone H1 [Rhodococcus sp. WS4]|nr:histone H1 [Rhodococcus sp. WS4]
MAISPRNSEGSAKTTTKEIREWAIGAGREVSLRGRISAEIEQAFHDAQAKKVQTKPAPVKKTATKKTATSNTAAAKAPAKKAFKEIREWAIGEGREVPSRGRIPAQIQQAFEDAQAKKVQTETAPVKKTTTKKTAASKAAAPKAPTNKNATNKNATNKNATNKNATKAAAEKTVAKKAVTVKVPVERAVVSKAPAKMSSREIREWAIGAGHEVSLRGRIPVEIQQAFDEAQGTKVQLTTAPVRKPAAKNAAARNTVAATGRAKKVPAKKPQTTSAPTKQTAVKKPVAAKMPVKVPVERAVVSEAPAKMSSREIREWAIGAGHEVSLRGRIPVEIERAFRDAQVKKVQAAMAPVGKAAAKKAAARKRSTAKAPLQRTAASTAPAKKTAGKKPVAAKVPVKVPVERAMVSEAPAKMSSREIREWAIGAGHEVSLRGRIPVEIERAFHDAQVEMPVA